MTSILLLAVPATNSLLINNPVGCSYDLPLGKVIVTEADIVLFCVRGARKNCVIGAMRREAVYTAVWHPDRPHHCRGHLPRELPLSNSRPSFKLMVAVQHDKRRCAQASSVRLCRYHGTRCRRHTRQTSPHLAISAEIWLHPFHSFTSHANHHTWTNVHRRRHLSL